MSRAPFQVLVIPVRANSDGIRYALFRRTHATGGYWQGIAGGGEGDESPMDAAKREAAEEAGLNSDLIFVQLDSMAMIPVVNVAGFQWGEETLVIPEYAFAAVVESGDCRLSDEHTEFNWYRFDDAMALLHWDSNRTALWELDWRIRHGGLNDVLAAGTHSA